MLPKKLGKEPLLDAIFELRFASDESVPDILPGILYMKGDGERKFERTQIADMPRQLRDNDPSLKYAILTYMNSGNYTIGVGEKVLNVASRLPYKGWKDFKQTILWALEVLDSAKVLQQVERFSLKYVDLIESKDTAQQISSLNVNLSVAGTELENQNFNLQTNLEDGDVRHVVTIVTNADVNVRDIGEKQGLIIDVDSQVDRDVIQSEDWHAALIEKLDWLHARNKEMFFNCLTTDALNMLEPSYE